MTSSNEISWKLTPQNEELVALLMNSIKKVEEQKVLTDLVFEIGSPT